MNDPQQNDERNPGRDHLFNETENHADKNENTDSNAGYLNNSSLQSETEFVHDKKSNKEKDDKAVGASGVDDLESNSAAVGGTDRGGTAERKIYGDIELNKGLEAQAKDEES